MSNWLTDLGLQGTTVVGGLAGALVSLKFIPGTNWWQRGTNAVGGMLAASYISPLLGTYLKLPPSVFGGIAFLIGMYGMTVANAGVEEIPKWMQGLREKYINRGDGQ